MVDKKRLDIPSSKIPFKWDLSDTDREAGMTASELAEQACETARANPSGAIENSLMDMVFTRKLPLDKTTFNVLARDEFRDVADSMELARGKMDMALNNLLENEDFASYIVEVIEGGGKISIATPDNGNEDVSEVDALSIDGLAKSGVLAIVACNKEVMVPLIEARLSVDQSRLQDLQNAVRREKVLEYTRYEPSQEDTSELKQDSTPVLSAPAPTVP